jgi:hypothetical protein
MFLTRRFSLLVISFLCLFAFTSGRALAQAPTFGGNAQHTSVYEPAAQSLNQFKWQATIDFNPGALVHYGAPLVTAGNTLITSVKTAGDTLRLSQSRAGPGRSRLLD